MYGKMQESGLTEIIPLIYISGTLTLTFRSESEEELKSLLMKVKEQSEKAGLKLNLQKMKIMTSGSITSWQIDGETMKTVRDFILGGCKITADGDYSHEIKRCLLLGRKAMSTQTAYSKAETLPADRGPCSQSYVFPVVMYGYESWAIKKAEHQRIDAFELWCWRRLFKSLLDCKEMQPIHPKVNQS